MRTTADKVNAGFAAALVIIAVIGVASITSLQAFTRTSREVSRAHSALREIESVLTALTEAESAQRGYVISGDERYIAPYENAAARIAGQIASLQSQHQDPAQQERLGQLGAMTSRRLELIRSVIEARRSGDAEAARALVGAGRGREVMDSIRAVTQAFEAAEQRELGLRNDRASQRARLAIFIIAGGSIFAFITVLLSALLIRRDHAERRRAEHALRESETLLSQFMENLPIGVIVVDAQWQPRFANNAAVDILGPGVLVDTGERPLPLYRMADGRRYPEAQTPLAQALAGRTGTIDDAEVLVGDRHIPVQVSAAPVYDASGRIAYAIAAFTDVTERRRGEEALRAAKDAAESASRTKSDFLARMSHELRTPLNSVIGFANILLKNKAGNLREQDTAYLDRILENGKHLLLLINDILDLSKIEAGKIEVEHETVDLHELIRGVVAQWEMQLRGGAVALRTVIPDRLDPLVTDSARLRQVLINLVGNAVKFTDSGSITVTVDTLPDSRRAARIRVTDTGIGIQDDRLEAIFDAFEQAESSTTRKYGGTGLGLPISRALCELLGYRLTVRSRIGAGTEFTIDMVPAGETLRGIPDEIVQAVAGRDESRDRLVLIVDDEPDSRILLTHYVEEFGCRAIATHSAQNALKLARELRPALITLDLMMPELNGWDVLQALKQDPELASIPVVIVSIIAQESRASLLGAIDLLQKPVDRGMLFAVLRRNLGSREARILVIEDEADARELMREMLLQHASEVRVAENGQAALATLRDFEPDLVITDLLMPQMDGMTFIEIFRGTPRFQGVPVIVVSAKDITGEERERLHRHTAAVVRKGNALEADLRRVLGSLLRPRDGG